MRRASGLVLAWLMLASPACHSPQRQAGSPDENGTPVVAVSNYPLKFFVEQVAGERVELLYPVDPGIDPAFWNPATPALASLQKADRIFLNGAGYESWLAGATLSESQLVDTTAGIRDRLIELTDDVVHRHGPQGERSRKATASTTWLDPQLAIAQARVVCDELGRLVPEHRDEFEENFSRLEQHLSAIRKRLNDVARQMQGQHLLVSHCVYRYLQRTLNVPAHRVPWEPDQEPAPEQWQELDELVAQHPIRLMLRETEPPDSVRQALKQRNIRVVVFQTLGNAPGEGNFIAGMLANIERLENALE